MNALWLIPILLIGLLAVGVIYQAVASHEERRKYPPPGRMVDIGGYCLHLNIMGAHSEGKPVVILDAGMISASPNWAWVQPEVAKETQVVAYDRAGLGWSDPGPRPRDAGTNAKELHAALQGAGIRGPYVLAGHSYGGLAVRAFAALFRDEVAGMVLVDASHPDQWVRFNIPSKGVWVGNTVASFLARFSFFRVFQKELRLLVRGLPPQQTAELLAVTNRPSAYAAAGEQAAAWDDISRPLVNAAGDLGNIPLIVLSVTEQPLKAKELTELQNELPGLSTNSGHITVQGAWHEGLVAQREFASVVTQAILQVVSAVCTGERLDRIPQ